MLVRLPMTNLKMTVRADYAVSVCSQTLFCIKASPPACQGVGISLWTDVCPPPHPPVASSEIKQTFLATNRACLLTFGHRAARLYLSIISTCVSLDDSFLSVRLLEGVPLPATLSSCYPNS